MLRLPDDVARMLRILVHDETVLEVPEQDKDEVARIVKNAMTFEWCPPGATIPVPIEIDMSAFGETWADCYAH